MQDNRGCTCREKGIHVTGPFNFFRKIRKFLDGHLGIYSTFFGKKKNMFLFVVLVQVVYEYGKFFLMSGCWSKRSEKSGFFFQKAPC